MNSQTLNHTEWECKYHGLRSELRGIFRNLARQKQSEIETGHPGGSSTANKPPNLSSALSSTPLLHPGSSLTLEIDPPLATGSDKLPLGKGCPRWVCPSSPVSS